MIYLKFYLFDDSDHCYSVIVRVRIDILFIAEFALLEAGSLHALNDCLHHDSVGALQAGHKIAFRKTGGVGTLAGWVSQAGCHWGAAGYKT